MLGVTLLFCLFVLLSVPVTAAVLLGKKVVYDDMSLS